MKILINEQKIKNRVKQLADTISKDYLDKNPVIVGILNGAFVFMADLIRNINIPLEVDFMAVSSYGTGTTTSGIVNIEKDLDIDIKNRHVIIVEDIVDTGLTLNYLYKYFNDHLPASIKICTLLNKPDRRIEEVELDYVGFNIDNLFVVGYGIDYANKYRYLPYVGYMLDSEII
jgi:hypoxanthine phosphoribosyltransferase